MRLTELGGTLVASLRPRARAKGEALLERAMTRRGALRTMAGAAGALAGAGVLASPARARHGGTEPRPIPGGIVVEGQGWHVYPPGHSVPLDPSTPINEPATITDLASHVAVAHVNGTGVGRQGGATMPLAFSADMRFMRGSYIARNGRVYFGTFGFIALGVYAGQAVAAGVPQIHDYSPGIAPSGLFRTIRIPDAAIRSDLDRSGKASFRMDHVRLIDSYNLANGLAGGPAEDAIVSFVARWTTLGPPKSQYDVANGFSLEYRDALASVSWTAEGRGFSFVSDPARTSTSVFAVAGAERNGIYFG